MMPIPATLFLGYGLLGAALFLFSAGIRAFPVEASVRPLATDARRRRRHEVALLRAIVSLVLATLLLLAGTIALATVAPQIL